MLDRAYTDALWRKDLHPSVREAQPPASRRRWSIHALEAMMMREKRQKGFFVAFGYSEDALREIGAFFKKSGKSIIALTVKDILEEQIAHKLA